MSLGRLFAALFAILILSVGIVLFGGGEGSSQTPSNSEEKSEVADIYLPNYWNTDARLVMTIDGRINGDDEHRAIKVTIGKEERIIQIIQGYNQNVIGAQVQYNNTSAFDNFLRAQQIAGFTSLNTTSKEPIPEDERGYCPSGKRYVFEMYYQSKLTLRRWMSSCSTSYGTLGVSYGGIEQIFEDQITDYDKVIADVDL